MTPQEYDRVYKKNRYYSDEAYRLKVIARNRAYRERKAAEKQGNKIIVAGKKQCSCCKKWFKHSEFYKSSRSKDGLDFYHKACRKEHYKFYQQKRRQRMEEDYKFRIHIQEKRREYAAKDKARREGRAIR